jgi:hypothetical protein
MLSGVALLGRYATALWAEARELSLAESHRKASGS